MKKHLAMLTIVCAIFGTSTLSAESYWDAFKSHFPGYRDYLPSFIVGQDETREAKPTKAQPAPKPAEPKPVANQLVAKSPARKTIQPMEQKPSPKPAVTQPVAEKPAPNPVASKPAEPKPLAMKPEPKPLAVKPEPKPHVVKQTTKAVGKVALPSRRRRRGKPSVVTPTKPQETAVVEKLNLRKGLETVMETLDSHPYTHRKRINREGLIGLVSFTKHVGEALKMSAFDRYVAELEQSVNSTSHSSKHTLPSVRTHLRKLAVIGANASQSQIKAAILATLNESLVMTKSAKASMYTVCGQLRACAVLVEGEQTPFAKDIQSVVAMANACLKHKTQRPNLAQNIANVIKRNK